MRRDIKNISQCIQIVFFWTAGTSAENEGLALQIVESREDVQLLKESKEQALRDKKAAEKRAETAEKQLKSLEERREQLQPIMDNVSKEIKECGTVNVVTESWHVGTGSDLPGQKNQTAVSSDKK